MSKDERQAGAYHTGSGLKISEEQFDRALDLMCAYEPDVGFSLGDVLAAILTELKIELPVSVVAVNAMRFLRENSETIG